MSFLVPHSCVQGSLLVTAHLGLSHTAQRAPGRKNLESKQTGAGGSTKGNESPQLTEQSRAGAELGAEPGPAAHQPGQIWWRTLIFNFPVKISSLLPLRSSQYSHSRGVISTCCFFSPVKWDFVPFISSKLCSTHPSVYSQSQGCLQHKEKSGMSSKSLHETWRDGKMCSSGVGVTAIRTPGAALFIYL